MIRITRSTKAAHRPPVSALTQVCVVTVLIALACVAGLVVHTWSQVLLSGRGRVCSVPWKGLSKEEAAKTRIAVVTLSATSADDVTASVSALDLAGQELQRLAKITKPNKWSYAVGQGYAFIDALETVNASRPTSWSKIPAVASALEQREWVLWADADTLVTDYAFQLQALLPRSSTGPDLILAPDALGTGFSAGVWLIRNSEWSKAFLQRWWALDEFVRHDVGAAMPGGEREALQHLLGNMRRKELHRRVGIAPQCAFNSFPWSPSWRHWKRMLTSPAATISGMWRPGDFLLHLEGVDDKAGALRAFFRQHGADQFLPQATTRTATADTVDKRGSRTAEDAGRQQASTQRASRVEDGGRLQSVAVAATDTAGAAKKGNRRPEVDAGDGATRKKGGRKGGKKQRHGAGKQGGSDDGGQQRGDKAFQKRKQRPKVTGREEYRRT